MSSFLPYGAPPSNPDARPLPEGWITQFDTNYQTWFYVNTRTQPPVITWEHPSGPPPPTGTPAYPSTEASPYPAEKVGGFGFPQAIPTASTTSSQAPYPQSYSQQPGFSGSAAQSSYGQPPAHDTAGPAPPSYDQSSGKPQDEKGMASKLATAAIAGKVGSKFGLFGGGKHSGSSSGGGGGLAGKLGGFLGGGSSGSHGGQQGGYGQHPPQQHGLGGFGAPQQMFMQHGAKPQKKKKGGMGGGAGLLMAGGAGLLGGALLADAMDDDFGGGDFGDF